MQGGRKNGALKIRQKFKGRHLNFLPNLAARFFDEKAAKIGELEQYPLLGLDALSICHNFWRSMAATRRPTPADPKMVHENQSLPAGFSPKRPQKRSTQNPSKIQGAPLEFFAKPESEIF